MAAEIVAPQLSLSEDQFIEQFHHQLQAYPIIYSSHYVGASVAPRTEKYLLDRANKRISDQEEKKRELQCVQERTKSAAEKRNQTKRNEKSSTGTPTRDQLTVSSAQFWKKMTEKLAGGNVSQAQAMQIVNQFKLLQTDYVSSMSLEDIEDMAKNV